VIRVEVPVISEPIPGRVTPDPPVDRVYFNLIKLAAAEVYQYRLRQFETVLVGKTQRSLIQNFDSTYRHLMDRIPGIAAMRESSDEFPPIL